MKKLFTHSVAVLLLTSSPFSYGFDDNESFDLSDKLEIAAIKTIDSLIYRINTARETLNTNEITDATIRKLSGAVKKFTESIDCHEDLLAAHGITENIKNFSTALDAYIADISNDKAYHALNHSKDKAILQLNHLKAQIQSLNGATVGSPYAGFLALAGFFATVAALQKLSA